MKPEHVHIVTEVLKEAGQPMTIGQIFKRATELYQKHGVAPLGRRNVSGFHTYMAESLRRGGLPFRQVSASPITIALNEVSGAMMDTVEEKFMDWEIPTETYSELELHPLLNYFVHNKWGLHTKTIAHKTSSAQSIECMDGWLYPDMVGVDFTYMRLGKTLQDFVEKFEELPV
ncbi:hypothetical protein [Helicobacter bizzozeronii]|uniref:hypothetical protein n=1 Tax=Helicobacter bizzozeronii TaxID=56877 RepID=UPI000CF19122|nr:hypothetical protein [Helicobacter bizzozeronii]